MASGISTKIKLEGEKEYRAALTNINQQQKTLKAEMEATTSAYDSNTSAEKKNADQTAYLAKQEDLQRQKIEKLKDMVTKATAAYGENDNKTLKLKQSLAQAKAEQNKMTSAVESGTTAANSNSQSMGSLVTSLGLATVAIAALKSGYDDLCDTMDNLDDIATESAQSGFSEETIQKWQYASEMIDVSSETIISAARKMKKNMASAPEDFDALGVSVTDVSGNMRDAETVFNETIQALSKIPNETERDQAAMNIFGKSADELAGIIDDGGAKLNTYGQEAENMGLILSGDTLDSVMAAKDATDQANASWNAAKQVFTADVLSEFAPVVEAAASAVSGLASAFASLPEPVKTTIVVLSSAALGFLAVQKAVAAINGFKALTSALPTLASLLTGTTAASGTAATAVTALGTSSAASAAGVKTMSVAMSTLADAGLAIAGIGTGILFAASGFSVLADSAESLSSAGADAKITMAAMVIGIGALGAVLSALSGPLTAGAIGIGVFGAAVLGIGAGIGAATKGIGNMMSGFADYNKSVSELAKNGEATAESIDTINDAEKSLAGTSMLLGTGISAANSPLLKLSAYAGTGAITMTAYAGATKIAASAADALADGLNAVYSVMKKLSGSSVSVGGTASGVKNYAQAMNYGMVLNSPTIFGQLGGNLLRAGDVGSETVVGTGSLMSMIARAVTSATTNNYGGATINVYGDGQNSNEIADRVLELVNKQNRISTRMGAH